MTLARRERLRELGLSPVWRRRAPASGVALADTPGTVGPPPEVGGRKPSTARPDDAESIACMDWDTLTTTIKACTRCALHQGRTQGVVGVGDRQADWLIIGEAPGGDEDRLGEPFVGQSGMLLDAMLAAIGLKRGDDVYIANVIKSRPPENRDPLPEEVAACLPYLERQIELIQPRLILALGRFAAQSLLCCDTSITKLRGRVHAFRGVPLVVTYHPAYLLRNPPDKAKVWEDLVLARATMAGLRAATSVQIS